MVQSSGIILYGNSEATRWQFMLANPTSTAESRNSGFFTEVALRLNSMSCKLSYLDNSCNSSECLIPWQHVRVPLPWVVHRASVRVSIANVAEPWVAGLAKSLTARGRI